MPHTAYIVEAVRTAGGKKNGRLRKWHPAELGATVLDELVTRTGIKGEQIDDVIFGCVDQVGEQALNIARNVILSSKKVPESVPGFTVDRQCGSSLQALQVAIQAVMSGTQDCVVAGGVESMTRVPIGVNITDAVKAGHGFPWGPVINEKYSKNMPFSQFKGAEMLAQKYDISKDELDNFAVLSHNRGEKATKEGRFKKEIVPLTGHDKEDKEVPHTVDEGIRPGMTLEQVQKLKTLSPKGRITAATSSQISDGAAAVMICNEQGLKKLGLKARAKVVALAVAGDDPVVMLYGPVPATQKVLANAKMTIDQIDLYEVNEAFGSVPLVWAKQVGASMDKLNVNGGAQALGHPLGGTGAKLMATLLHEMERRGARYGLEAICEGGGMANALIIERVGPDSKL